MFIVIFAIRNINDIYNSSDSSETLHDKLSMTDPNPKCFETSIVVCTVCGIPGAGKSSFCRQLTTHLNTFDIKCITLSFDDIEIDLGTYCRFKSS